MTLRYSVLMLGIVVSMSACSGQQGGKSRGAIVLGDSSTIITETNEVLLQDQVPDLKPVIASEEPAQTPNAKDTTLKTATGKQAPNTQVQTESGLTVPFKEVTLSIPGIAARSFGKPDLQKGRGASYELTSGNLAGAQLRISGGAVTKVSQRYETIIMLQDGSDKLPLESLGKYTSAWQALSGGNGAYAISGLEAAKLEFKQANNAAIRNAVQQAARRKRLNRADAQDWLAAVKNVRAANQSPATVMLHSVMWRVEGKGFSKELRVDVPIE